MGRRRVGESLRRSARVTPPPSLVVEKQQQSQNKNPAESSSSPASNIRTKTASTSPSDDDEFDLSLNVRSTITMKARGSDTIKDIKARFCNQGGVSESLHDILLDGVPLDDSKTLDDYGVQKISTLDLTMNTSMVWKLSIKVPTKQLSTMVIVKASDTVQYIKSIIETKVGSQSSDFSLMHGGKLLGDSQTLASLNIASESTLYVFPNPKDVLSILVRTPAQRTVRLEVRLLSNVRNVKMLIGSMTGTPVEHVILVYGGHSLEDSRTLAYYGIEDNALLELMTSFQIFVKTLNGKTITLEVHPSDTTEQLNEKVFKKLGLPVRRHPLVLNGKQLVEGTTLESYNIQKHSMIFMRCSMNIMLDTSGQASIGV